MKEEKPENKMNQENKARKRDGSAVMMIVW